MSAEEKGLGKNKIYFGHPINFYNTPKESELIQKIENFFPEFEIENPNQEIHQKNYTKWKEEKGNGMKYYFEEVLPKMEAGIFLAFEDGMFGKGVFGEAEFLYKKGKEVYEINTEGKITSIDSLDYKRCLSIEDTRKRVYKK
jgi:hypothetical protein